MVAQPVVMATMTSSISKIRKKTMDTAFSGSYPLCATFKAPSNDSSVKFYTRYMCIKGCFHGGTTVEILTCATMVAPMATMTSSISKIRKKNHGHSIFRVLSSLCHLQTTIKRLPVKFYTRHMCFHGGTTRRYGNNDVINSKIRKKNMDTAFSGSYPLCATF